MWERVGTAADIEFVMPGGMTLRGHEQTLGVVSAFWEGIPDVKVTPEKRAEARILGGTGFGYRSGEAARPTLHESAD
jgi:hypothetical protein